MGKRRGVGQGHGGGVERSQWLLMAAGGKEEAER